MRTYTIRELSKITDIDARTIRRYVQRGILEAPPFRGAQTRYSDAFLTRLLAIRTLKGAHYSTDKVGSILAQASEEEIAELAGEPLAHAAPRPAADPADAPPVDAAAAPRSRDRWTRIVLFRGLELFVREGAGELVERLAAEIEQRYGVRE
jgi:DNA-binding transcriptional MerR regulator